MPKSMRHVLKRQCRQAYDNVKTGQEYLTKVGLFFSKAYPEYEKACQNIVVLMQMLLEEIDGFERKI